MRRRPVGRLAASVTSIAAGLAVAMVIIAPHRAAAQEAGDTAEEIERVQQSIEESTDLRQELDQRIGQLNQEVADLRVAAVNASMEIMNQHQILLEIERDLGLLETEEAAWIVKLDVQRDKLSHLLGGLTRLARVPPETMFARPSAPVDALRTATLLRAAVPAIEDEARVLRRQLSQLATVRTELSNRRDQANAQRDGLDARIAEMNDLIQRREGLVALTETERLAVEDRLQQLADEADTLLELLDRLIAEAPAEMPAAEAQPESSPAEREAAAVETALAEGRELVHGQVASRLSALPVFDGVIMPASGEITVRYGQPNAFGETNRGLTLKPYPGAPVVAPLDGEVRFAGQFKGYGRLLILEHAGGYHSLIAGFGRLDARAGQQVLAGEPVGVTALPQSGDTGNLDLYFEFRSNGQPINPVQGLALARESVRG